MIYLRWLISDYFIGKSLDCLRDAAVYRDCPQGSYGARLFDLFISGASFYGGLAAVFS